MEEQMKNIDYILNTKLSENELRDKDKINNRSTNELHPIPPNEFLNNVPSYLVSDLPGKKRMNRMRRNYSSVDDLSQREECKKIFSELSVFDQLMLDHCKVLRIIAKGLKPENNVKETQQNYTSKTVHSRIGKGESRNNKIL